MNLLKTKHRYSIWLIIFSNLLFSCKEKESKKINKSNSINQPYQYRNLLVDQLDQIPLYISPLQNDSTFISVYVTPNTPREVDINNKTEKDYFFSDTVNKLWITKYQLKQNQIQTIRSKLLLENEWTYLVMDSNSFKNIQISGVPYLYFSSHETPMGRAVDMNQEVNFHLINLIDISDYCLVYEGHPSFKCADCIDGKFSDNKNLEKILKF